jgi:uncharacterized lipoprotein YddW (UPF0748 family)
MMIGHRSLVVFLLLSVVVPASSQPPPKREFRAAWVASVTNLDWPTTPGGTPATQKTQLINLLDALQMAGINVVIFQVRPECDALYASPYEPWSYYLTGTQGAGPNPAYDPLQFAVEESHKRGMELHAWFNPYRAVRSIGQYPIAPSHVSAAHPDWILTFPSTKLKILNPGLEAVRDHVARVVADIVRRYDVDGVHADDYFYPYDPIITNEDAATFAAYPRGFVNVGDWRRDNVNLLMKMVTDSIAAIKPYVKFGMSPFGIWKNGVPPGIIGLDAYSTIYGDAIAWLQQRSVDYLTPQLYWPIGGSQDYVRLMNWWADSCASNGRHLYPGHGAYRISSWSAGELPAQIRLNRGNPKAGGSVFFRAYQGILDNPKGFLDSLRNDFYKYPSLLPSMAWKDVVPPYMPRNIRYERPSPAETAALLWDLPLSAPDGDSASRYAVYRFDHTPTLPADLADAKHLLAVVGARRYTPPTPPPGGPYSYVVTSLDRNFNESEPSTVLVLGPPAVPVLATPANGTPAVAESVLVTWRSVALASFYHLQVSTDSFFVAALVVNDSTITDTVKTVRGYPGLSTVYWRVRSKNGAGTSDYSGAFAFTSGFPAVTVTLYPPNSALDIPVQTPLRWDNTAGATSYRVQMALSSTFSPTVVDTAGLSDTTFTPALLDYYKIYFWRVKASNSLGAAEWSPYYRFRTVQVTTVDRQNLVPEAYALSQNYPNPFNPTTAIQIAVPSAGRVVLKVFDVLGREETTLVDAEMQAGSYTVTFDASRLASGTYFYRMQAGEFVATKRMLLLR